MTFTNKQLFTLIIPLMVETILNSLMGTADAIMVTTAGNEAISAVSLVDSINVLVVNVFAAMATGGAILTSQFLGRQDYKNACHTAKQLILSITFISVLGTLFCLAFRKPMLRILFGSLDPVIMENCLVYFFITALSFPFIALYNGSAAIFRSDKNSRLPMTISTISNIINVAGNAILIFVFKMGVMGAALSTLLSRIFSAVTILIFLRTTKQQIQIKSYLSIRPDFKAISKIFRIGIPTGIENGMFQFGKLAIQSSVSLLTASQIAANAMVASLESFSCQAAIGIGLGIMTVIGQCIGAGDSEGAVKYIKKLTFWAFLALFISSVIVSGIVFPVTYFSKMEQTAAQLTIFLTIAVHIVKPFAWCWSFIPAYGLRAAGDVKFCMSVSIVTMFTLRVAIAVVLIRMFGFGPEAVWIAMATDWSVRSIIFAIRFRTRKWLRHQLL
ncbi:MAG: MATE family efflux transporter [Treponema sp.]|nr:MATE family efflux transporter [Candidatus Treponema equifaecale]